MQEKHKYSLGDPSETSKPNEHHIGTSLTDRIIAAENTLKDGLTEYDRLLDRAANFVIAVADITPRSDGRPFLNGWVLNGALVAPDSSKVEIKADGFTYDNDLLSKSDERRPIKNVFINKMEFPIPENRRRKIELIGIDIGQKLTRDDLSEIALMEDRGENSEQEWKEIASIGIINIELSYDSGPRFPDRKIEVKRQPSCNEDLFALVDERLTCFEEHATELTCDEQKAEPYQLKHKFK